MAATRTALKNFSGIRASVRTLVLGLIVLLGLVAAAIAQPTNAQKALQLPTEYADADGPNSIAQADFNQDGIMDLAVGNGDGTVTIFLGQSDGSFKPLPAFSASFNPVVQIATADFNGDGMPDLIVAINETPNSFLGTNALTIFYGNGDGSFSTSPLSFPTINGNLYQMAVGDLNGDGVPDIVTATNDFLTVLLSTAGGYRASNLPSSGPGGVAIADVNLDGKPDVVSSNFVGNSVSMFLGNGNGTFAGPLVVSAGSMPTYVLVADFNGDGKPDLAVVNQGDNNFSVLLGNGDGTFGSPSNTSTNPNIPVLLTAGDFNGDGKLDLAVTSETSTAVGLLQIFVGKADGTFSTPAATYQGNGRIAGDYNHDGKLDLVIENATTVGIISGNGDGTLQTATWLAGGANPYALLLTDVNSDGKPDLITGTNSGFNVQLGNGDGTFQSAISNTSYAAPATFLASGDINADQVVDIAITSTSVPAAVFFGNNDGTFVTHGDYFPPGTNSLLIADFTKDGYGDLMQVFSSSELILYPFDPTTKGFGTPQTLATSVTGFIAVADFNHDGIPDLVVPSQQGLGNYGVSVILGTSPSYFAGQENFFPSLLSSMMANQVAVGDFNGDGNPDVAIAVNDISGTGHVEVFLGNGDGTFSTKSIYAPINGGVKYLAVGDFNGDGKLDVAVTGTNTVNVFLGNGDGTLQTTPQTFTIPGANYLVAGDINGDGLTDLAVMDSSGYGISLLFGNGAVVKLASSINPSEFDEATSLSATVTRATKSDGAPTGSVNFYSDGSLLSKASLTGDTAVLNVASLTPGTHTLTAVYSGDSNFPTAHGALIQTVAKAPTSVLVASSVNPVVPTALVTFTASVVPATSGTPTGSVTFLDGATPLGSAPVNGSGQAILTTSSLTLGSNTITAQYSGDVDYLAGFGSMVEAVGGGVATISPSSLNFGTLGLNKESEPLYATLTNTGNLALSVASVLSNSVEFIVSGNCPSSLPVNNSCTITTRFKPRATGQRNSTFTVTDNYGAGLQTVNLTGFSVSSIVNLSSTSEVFPTELVGNSSAAKTITLTNTSTTATLTITSIAYSGDFPAAAVTNPCPNSGTVAPGAQCNLGVLFTPTTAGNRTGAITFTDSDSTGQQVVGLSGVGSALKITPSSLSFGKLDIGVTSPAKQVVVVNLGSSPITLNGISVGAGFAIAPSSTCGSTLGANAACALEITFSPAAAGTQSGSLTINSSDPVSPSTVKLSGVGTIVQLAPTALNFGSQGIGTASSPQSAVLTNLGTVAVNISSILIAGADPGDFTIQPSSTCSVGTSVPPTSGNSCTIAIAFQPATAGTRSATLSVADDGGGTQSVSLKGTGVAALVSITVTPATPTIASGSTQQFTATGTYSDSTTKNLTSSVTWSSSSIGVATISNTSGTQGQAHAVAAGSTNIIATLGAVSGVTTLTITP
jgi:hypothetical protein